MQNIRYLILGAGLAGLSTAYHLEQKEIPYLLIEKSDQPGGVIRTDKINGFYFDKTGHWLHLRHDYARSLVERLLGDNLLTIDRISRIYSHKTYTHYPFQANTFGLPKEVVYECLSGFIQARDARQSGNSDAPRNFEEWIYHHFGKGIADHFMIPYNTKLWSVPPSEITSEWCGRFVPQPKLEDVLRGAFGLSPQQMGYNATFTYPRYGGIWSLGKAFLDKIDPTCMRLNTTPVSIDTAARIAVLSDGTQVHFEQLISSIPLPELVSVLSSVPDEVSRSAGQLRCNSLTNFNVALKNNPRVPYHWIYVPGERFPFYRIGSYSNAVPSLAPEGRGSLYVEISHTAKLDIDTIRKQTRAGLIEMGIIQDEGEILFEDRKKIANAYVIFDDFYFQATNTIFTYLSGRRITPIGRYGAWTYASMEDAIMEGKAVGDQAETR